MQSVLSFQVDASHLALAPPQVYNNGFLPPKSPRAANLQVDTNGVALTPSQVCRSPRPRSAQARRAAQYQIELDAKVSQTYKCCNVNECDKSITCKKKCTAWTEETCCLLDGCVKTAFGVCEVAGNCLGCCCSCSSSVACCFTSGITYPLRSCCNERTGSCGEAPRIITYECCSITELACFTMQKTMDWGIPLCNCTKEYNIKEIHQQIKAHYRANIPIITANWKTEALNSLQQNAKYKVVKFFRESCFAECLRLLSGRKTMEYYMAERFSHKSMVNLPNPAAVTQLRATQSDHSPALSPDSSSDMHIRISPPALLLAPVELQPQAQVAQAQVQQQQHPFSVDITPLQSNGLQ